MKNQYRDEQYMHNQRRERIIRNNRIRRQKELRRNFLLTVATLCLVVIISVSVGSFLSNAKDDSTPVSYKYYKSITISKDDTLWSIAKEYMDEEHYDSVNDYIEEVMQMNSLSSDQITYGSHLIVPYYSDEYIG